jgi:diadenosine tetraphosphatase ApaH/serine/threonine PP2A family protein phosphatase
MAAKTIRVSLLDITGAIVQPNAEAQRVRGEEGPDAALHVGSMASLSARQYNRPAALRSYHSGGTAVRYLVMSDIHANLSALEAVLADAPPHEGVICLGDLVGYGPDPNECIERVRGLPCTCLSGNHDWGVLGKLELDGFNRDARAANEWARETLSDDSREYLRNLPPRRELQDLTIVHASPREPIWEYVLDARVAMANFEHFSTAICLVGHSHVPLVYALDEKRERCTGAILEAGDRVALGGERALINPGSVGQPRDGDPRASYAILDTEDWTWEACRVGYAIEEVQARMRERRLPARLIRRLAVGY